MRQQLEEIPQLRQMLREQSSLLEKTNKNVIAISRSLQDVRDSQPKQVILRQYSFSFLFMSAGEKQGKKQPRQDG